VTEALVEFTRAAYDVVDRVEIDGWVFVAEAIDVLGKSGVGPGRARHCKILESS
jgi:hypothetical protein